MLVKIVVEEAAKKDKNIDILYDRTTHIRSKCFNINTYSEQKCTIKQRFKKTNVEIDLKVVE